MEYQYGTKLRPAGIGCQPMNGLLRIEDLDKRTTGCWSKITYDRKLTEEEIYKYDLKELK